MNINTISNFIFIILLLFSNLSAQEKYIDSHGNTQLLGSIDPVDLEITPYKDWYSSRKNEYNSNLKSDITDRLKDVRVKIFIGTWCGDTKKYLPKFIKFWEEAKLSNLQLDITALHSQGKEYKRSPDRTESKYNIHRVPTFIFERDGKVIGKIVERPVTDLVTDITQIACGVPATPRYQGVTILHEYFLTQSRDSLYPDLDHLYSSLYRNVSGPGALNTYGYVLMAAGRYEEAELAFRVNIKLFPFDPNLRDSLGELFVELERYAEAKECFEKVLDIKNEDESASQMLETIKKKLEN